MKGQGPALAFVLSTLSASACSSPVDLKQAVQATDVTSGWFDAGVVGGKNKLVPTVTFRLKKAADADVPPLALNVVLKREGDTETDHWDDIYVQRVDFVDGVQTAPITVRSETGYTGDPPQSRLEMLRHSGFRDMDAQIFAKASSSQWIELHRLRIARQLLTQ